MRVYIHLTLSFPWRLRPRDFAIYTVFYINGIIISARHLTIYRATLLIPRPKATSHKLPPPQSRPSWFVTQSMLKPTPISVSLSLSGSACWRSWRSFRPSLTRFRQSNPASN